MYVWSTVFLASIFSTFVDAAPFDHHSQSRHRHARQHNMSPAPSPAAPSVTTMKRTSFDLPFGGSLHPPHVRMEAPFDTLAALFPVERPGSEDMSWTTAPVLQNTLPLTSSTLNPTHLLSTLSITFASAPDGKFALKAHYPKGSYTLTREPKGGISFYASGPVNVDLSVAKEVTFGYSVYFDEGFEWQKGGKLPGLCKLSSADEDYLTIREHRWRRQPH